MFIQLYEREERERKLKLAERLAMSREAYQPPIRALTRPEVPSPPPDARPRGIYRAKASFDGIQVFDLVDSLGRLRWKLEARDEDATLRTVAWLNRVLDALDPPAPRIFIVG